MVSVNKRFKYTRRMIMLKLFESKIGYGVVELFLSTIMKNDAIQTIKVNYVKVVEKVKKYTTKTS